RPAVATRDRPSFPTRRSSDLQKLKVEHIETGLAGEETLSFYRQGEFLDLCRGKHIPSTGHIGKAFKLLNVAGAYWKGDASRDQLDRKSTRLNSSHVKISYAVF